MKIPTTVITGFLGAGKTTLVRHLLEHAGGRRIAVIVNEFGAIGIDREVLRACDIPGCTEDDIIELANGCLCCTVADDFVPAMTALLERALPPDHILIETSGLALPKPLLKAFNWPSIRSRVTVDGVIAVVDGPAVAAGRFADDPAAVAAQRAADPSVEHDNPLAEVYEDQIRAADLIVLNKTDLLDAATATAVAAMIAERVPRAVKVVPAREGKLDPAVLLGLAAAAEDDLAARPSHHDAMDGAHEHDDFASFSLELPEITDPEALLGRLRGAAALPGVLRVKGFAAVAGKPLRLAIQEVGARFRQHYDRAWPAGAARAGHLVVIGQTGFDRAAITAAILYKADMHLLVRDSSSLDDDEPAADLGQTPADLVFLSFSDSDLGAAAAAWQAMAAPKPTLRLANLARLRHPMSVDRYAEQVVAHASCVVVRLLGGVDYWRYGAEEVFAVCRANGIALALVPGDARDDARLADLSTVPIATRARLDAYLREGGAANVARALRLAAHLGGVGDDPAEAAAPVPAFGAHDFGVPAQGAAGLAAIVFYRSHVLAADLAPLAALAAALAGRGLGVRALFVGSLKDSGTAAFVADRLRAWRPAVVLNATGFSARRDDGTGSPLDAADAPVLQLVLAGSARAAWAASARGLSPADLAMQVVLPELDGRLATTAISFKAAAAPIPGLEFARTLHAPDAAGIALAADRAAGWARLAATPRAERVVAVVLSDYPGAGGGQVGHAVGLDTFASLAGIIRLLGDAGYAVGDCFPGGEELARLLTAPFHPTLSLAAYNTLFADLPEPLRAAILAAWGEPTAAFPLPLRRLGNLILAVQPDRGAKGDRRAGYHDADTPPCHAYVAFHLWLRRIAGIHAVVHLGTHGTLEWLPGKAVAPGEACASAALLRGLPVIYPFIVNNPGEAAAARRRLGAVTIGHLTPPLAAAGLAGEAADLERLLDDYAAADGLDRRRTALLRRDILDRAAATDLLAEAGAAALPDDAALARLDAYLCDVKDMQIRHGLHVFGAPPTPERRAQMLAACPALDPAHLDDCAGAERAALLAALDARFIPPGPAGAPSRGRIDVLPTGRNLFAIDPRAVPTRAALALAERAAVELLRRHMQEHGDWPRSLVLDLWGSATMRTGGEDFALALLLLGVRPLWDDGSARVSGFEVVPLALLDRPRVDVTLRISGLFRDAFPTQLALFDAAVRAVAARDEAADWNRLAGADRPLRIYGAAPGDYGAGVAPLVAADHGAAYLAASAHAYGRDHDGTPDAEGFAARVAGADAFLHAQDHRETDVLDGPEFAAHEGGFAAAATLLGAAPTLYHADTSRPEAPAVRTLAEEVARVVRGRAANPRWIASVMAHGHNGAVEISRAVDGLFAFAATLPTRLDAQFDLLFAATLGDAAVDRFLADANPAARAAIRARFAEAMARGLWRSRRNDVAEVLG